jgi:uncharacterized protein YbaR (Trm112 family)
LPLSACRSNLIFSSSHPSTTRLSVISNELLQILRCPDNRTPLALAEPALVERCNHLVRQRRLKNKAGLPVEHTLDGGMVRADHAVLYPIIDEIPVLLVDEGIPLDQLEPKKQ